ncbi:hypothetical protein [Anaeromicrobium sediminis]|uniref:Uncharacterized protein n=1 Tax=Anaeromicrobium sediminis TaxID=1478221 RepID=A0A267MM23_9FIRM|nr:hypothetical protein [Anaeromicrobium sediminis]PAB60654.1 hypothetical protein CCE28_03685 [Anaeromicrobium sediminis]
MSTSAAFLGMKYLFQRIIEDYSEIEFIEATEGGLRIERAINKTFKEDLDVARLLKNRSLSIHGFIKSVN